jgi:hypothetical protein
MIEKLTAGDTLSFDTTVVDYPASDGWTLTYRLVPTGTGTVITFTASANGDAYAVSVSAATTANWAAGDYSWSSYVSLSGERYTVEQGFLTISPNPATYAAGTDLRSHARIVLDAVEAVIEGRASLDQEEYTINGRSLKRTKLEDLLKFRAFYKMELAKEEAAKDLAAGLGYKKSRVLVRI